MNTSQNVHNINSLCEPRAFFLEPITDEQQAWTQAGEYKKKVFGDLRDRIPWGSKKTHVEAKLLHRRLVPFWHVRCKSHIEYARQHEYRVTVNDPRAVQIVISGPRREEIKFPLDDTGRAKRVLTLTGTEWSILNEEIIDWVDSYVQRDEFTVQPSQEEQKRFFRYTQQRLRPISDLREFLEDLAIGGAPLFDDKISSMVFPPLETAETVVYRSMNKMETPPSQHKIVAEGVDIEVIDLYYLPLFVFQFEKLDEDNRAIDRKLMELDALDRNRWMSIGRTEFQKTDIPWQSILKLSLEIGKVVLREIPVAGSIVEIADVLAEQTPGIVNDFQRE